MRKTNARVIVFGYLLPCLLLLPIAGLGQTAAPGYTVNNFATGFPNFDAIGPVGLAFDSSGNLFVDDFITGVLYKFSPAGGTASAATQVNATPFFLGSRAHGLAVGKDGNLYVSLYDLGEVGQLDPVTGQVARILASGIFHPRALATDPLSGDLFVSEEGSTIFRISNFASGPGTLTTYVNTPFTDGIAFGPDGTLYGADQVLQGVVKISGTNSPPPTPSSWTFIASVPLVDGMAVSANPSTPFLYGNRNNGTITKIDLTAAPPVLTDIVTGGSRGDLAAVGPDGCLYATQTDRVIKVTNADGTCLPPPLGPLFPTTPSAAQVFIDIKPQSCPNPINVGAQGVLPVAILGTATFDVTTVDPSSVKLKGASPLRWALEDVATPFTGALANATSCTTAGPDGFTDLVFSFSDKAVAAALGAVTNDQVLVLTLTGNLLPQFGGTPITGQDIVVIKQ